MPPPVLGGVGFFTAPPSRAFENLAVKVFVSAQTQREVEHEDAHDDLLCNTNLFRGRMFLDGLF